ncbi:hypothetical protein COX08_00205 [Candidatus Beckwithbacteria bacterium CG23_combo_of_CG06-09_8_20_14_all_34_8]|uniref:tetrahydrofolate synthase n=1 Tax=Candidatus Beckwithbacteria bacterium CG23_combo_of_CG06-09_8_20_14_all_34_8 TaxID=1974497 RepID=A0A2H0B7E1_9BACT|nr:MAG: hypothetical protein COX08_00205 [Candidatus Beckwithbacteria bacterium CG23_combo_of_CG06-09_8_20_14_all_34_8]
MNRINTFKDAIAYFESFILSSNQYTKNFRFLKLDRTYNLLKLLGNPHQEYPIIHITGTSGKGSTSMMAAAILQEAGYKVGLHTSPHLQKVTERYLINQQLMSNDVLIQYCNKLKKIIDWIIENDIENKPSYFEILVCLAFLYFADYHVDWAVIEVGMGGRFDSTNVCNSRVSVITNIGLDHTKVLGDTIKKIVTEKMMIIKPNTLAVTGVNQPSALKIVRDYAVSVNTKLLELNQDFSVNNYKLINDKNIFNYKNGKFSFDKLELSLCGQYQAYNASLAITTVLALKDPKINERIIRQALNQIYFPGRMEQLKLFGKNIIMDGAHNPMKMQALSNTLVKLFPKQKMPIFFCAKYDKDMTAMIKNLLPIASEFIITSFSALIDSGKNVMASKENIYKAIRKIDKNIKISKIDMQQIPDIIKSLKNDNIIITGSLYFIGEVRNVLRLSWHSHN